MATRERQSRWIAARAALVFVILVAATLRSGEWPSVQDGRFVGRWRGQWALGRVFVSDPVPADDTSEVPLKGRYLNAHLQATLSIVDDGGWSMDLLLGRESIESVDGRWDSVGDVIRLWVASDDNNEGPDVWVLAGGKLAQRESSFMEFPEPAPALRRLDVGTR